MSERRLTVRICSKRDQTARDIAAIEGISFNAFTERALIHEIESCRRALGSEFDLLMEKLRIAREKLEEPQS